MKPLIGITCNLEEKTIAGINKRNFHDLALTYTQAIQESGGIPLIIPNSLSPEEAIQLAQRLDGFLFSGGADVGSTPERDETELLLLKYLLEHSRKPIFGICRGIQVINVASGGTLIQDLPSAGKNNHTLTDQPRKMFTHEIIVQEDTRLSRIMKKERRVNSFHHQAVDRLGKGLIVSAYSSKDQVIEAIEASDDRYLLAVQWHPEELTFNAAHRRLFTELVRQASC